MMKPILSAVLIVKNESAVLARTLSSLRLFCDEIIVVDTGSTDTTRDVAREFTDLVFDFVWTDNFATARSFADSKAHGKYLCRWDADWWISPVDAQKIEQLKIQEFTGVDVVKMTWVNRYDPDTLAVQWSQSHNIIYKKNVFEWHFPVHEYLKPVAEKKLVSLDALDILVYHDKEQKPLRYLQDTSIISRFAESLASSSPDFVRAQLFLAQDSEFHTDITLALSAYNKVLENTTDFSLIDFVQEKIILLHLKNKDISAATDFVDQIPQNNAELPRTFLAIADLTAVSISPLLAVEKYQRFESKISLLRQDSWGFDTARYVEHPHFMIQKITASI